MRLRSRSIERSTASWRPAPARGRAARLLEMVLASSPTIRVRAWDGSKWPRRRARCGRAVAGRGPLRRAGAERARAGRAYVSGLLDFEGDVYDILRRCRSTTPSTSTPAR